MKKINNNKEGIHGNWPDPRFYSEDKKVEKKEFLELINNI
tara:strand:- start:525 stop:644 length:120 start_codon:yes stop_codon:yes gene_type:complete